MAYKHILYDLRGMKVGKLVNWRNNPLTTSERMTLGASLSSIHSGLEAWDTDEKKKYIWDGDDWLDITGSASVPPEYVTDEHVNGVLNGSNNVFTTDFNFDSSTLTVFLNGLKIFKIDDYNTTGANQITLNVAPGPTETIYVNYKKI